MEKLQTLQEVTQVANLTEYVTKAIQSLVMQSDGLPLTIDGEEKPYRLTGGVVSKVRVGTAWIAFSYDECILKTKETKDRDAFLSFLTEGGSPSAIRFTKVCGCLKRPVEKEEAKKKQSSFVPRSRTYGRRIGFIYEK